MKPGCFMIDANNTWVLWSIIVGIATISIFLENRYKWAAKISGAIIGLLMAATLSNLGVIPTDSPVYDQVWGVVVPLAIPMLLFQCDLKQIWKESGRLLAIFLISSVGTVLGAVLGYLALSKAIPVLNHIAGMMVGSYIGGGVNFVAVSSAFDIPKELISAATVADNLLMVFYFLILLMIPLKYSYIIFLLVLSFCLSSISYFLSGNCKQKCNQRLTKCTGSCILKITKSC